MNFKVSFQSKVDLMELALAEYLHKNAPHEPRLAQAVNWAVSSGGKRIRPVLTLCFAELCGGDVEEAVPFAIAVEFIHSYSLVHDDMPCMDNAEMRRGKATVHRQFGEATALLTGDALLTEAFAALCSGELLPEKMIQACRILAAGSGALGGMISGQMTEMECGGNCAEETVLRTICEGKTSALLESACMLGVVAGFDGCAPKELLLAAKKYGRMIGLAFQMIDDIFDLPEDAAAGRTTFATLWGIEKTRLAADELTREAKKSLDIFDEDKSFLSALADWLLRREY